jgi:hypothetical protein
MLQTGVLCVEGFERFTALINLIKSTGALTIRAGILVPARTKANRNLILMADYWLASSAFGVKG